MNQALLKSYETELQKLVDDGKLLADASTNAGTIGQLYNSADPFVTQMVQAFAYTLARLNLKLEAERQLVPSALLQLLYPTVTRPVPARTIVQFLWDMNAQVAAEGRTIDPGTPLRPAADVDEFGVPQSGGGAEFRTANACVLPPVRFTRAHLLPTGEGDKNARRLRLQIVPAGRQGQRLADVTLHLPALSDGDRRRDEAMRYGLRVFLGKGDSSLRLYRALTMKPVRLELSVPGKTPVVLNRGKNCVRMVGFDTSESLLPCDARQAEVMRLLTEYAVMREKFMFVDLFGLEKRYFVDAEEQVFLDLLLDPEAAALIEDMELLSILQLGCVPVVNLETPAIDAVPLHRTSHEVGFTIGLHDGESRDEFEVFELEEVRATSQRSTDLTYVNMFAPLDYKLSVAKKGAGFGYRSERRERRQPPLQGDDMKVSLLEFDPNRTIEAGLTLNVKATCFRREVSDLADGGARFRGEQCHAQAVTPLYPPAWPSLHPDAVLSLLQALSCGAGLFHGTDDAKPALVRLLSLHGTLYPGEGTLTKLLDGSFIRAVTVRTIAAALPDGIARGTELTVTVQAVGQSMNEVYLLVRVLDHALSAFCAAGGFTQLKPVYIDRNQTKELAECPPRVGKVALV